jgi:hypothetical protein
MAVMSAGVSRPRSWFYVSVAILAAAVVFVGFSRTFYLNAWFARRDLPALVIVHGAIATAWVGLLVVQSWLVASRRTDIHRRLGVAGAILALLMIVVGLATARQAAKYGFQTPGLPPATIFVVVPFFDIVVFAILVAIGLHYRRRTDIHKRLMLLATLSILPPAIARIPLSWITSTLPVSAFLIADLILLACVAIDWRRSGRLHRAYLWGGLLVVLSFPLRLAVAGTPVWQAFVQWAIS